MRSTPNTAARSARRSARAWKSWLIARVSRRRRSGSRLAFRWSVPDAGASVLFLRFPQLADALGRLRAREEHDHRRAVFLPRFDRVAQDLHQRLELVGMRG